MGKKKYLDQEKEREKIHRKLAEYFYSKADPILNKTWQGTSPRAFSKLPYHLILAHMWGTFRNYFN